MVLITLLGTQTATRVLTQDPGLTTVKADWDHKGSTLKSERQNWGEQRLGGAKDQVTESLTEETGFTQKATRSLQGIWQSGKSQICVLERSLQGALQEAGRETSQGATAEFQGRGIRSLLKATGNDDGVAHRYQKMY